MQRPAAFGVQMHPFELFEIDDAEQRVAADEFVVDESEWLGGVHRDQPERQLGHLDGHRVDVRAVQAVLDDQPPGLDDYRVGFGVDGVAEAVTVAGHLQCIARLARRLRDPRLDEPAAR